MAVIKTRFGKLELQSTTEAAKVEVATTQKEPTINSDTPLLVQINGDSTTDIYKINTTNTTLKDVINNFVDKDINNSIILNENNKLVLNTSNLALPLATIQAIGGVKDSDSTLINFIHVHQDGELKGQMEVNSLNVEKLQQTNWLILDSEDADGEFTATTEAK